MLPLTAADIYRAQERLRGVAAATPVLSSPVLDAAVGRTVVCKAESLQRTGSFKFRGTYDEHICWHTPATLSHITRIWAQHMVAAPNRQDTQNIRADILLACLSGLCGE